MVWFDFFCTECAVSLVKLTGAPTGLQLLSGQRAEAREFSRPSGLQVPRYPSGRGFAGGLGKGP